MRTLFMAAVLLAAPAGAADRSAFSPDPGSGTAPITVRLVWSDPANLLPMGFDVMAQEVHGIFRRAGVEVVWRLAEAQPAEGDERNVILLPNDPAGSLHRRETMGRVERTAHTALWVFARKVRQTLGLSPATVQRATLEDQRDYPRALGRIVAHELVHAIVPDEPHAERGLMQATLNRAVLAAPRVDISERCADLVVRELEARSAEGLALLATASTVDR
jgi:hypothetical protein